MQDAVLNIGSDIAHNDYYGADGDTRMNVDSSTIEAGVAATVAIAGLFKGVGQKNAFGCTQRQMEKGKCAAYNAFMKEQQMRIAQAEMERRRKAVEDQKKKKTTGIVVGISLGTIMLILTVLLIIKIRKANN